MRFFSFFRCLTVILILALIFTFVSSLSSCNKSGITASEVMDAVIGSQNDKLPSSRNVYDYSASLYSQKHMSDEMVSAIYYDGQKSDNWEFTLLSDYSVRLGDDDSQFEIHIFKVRYRSDVDTVEKFLSRRLERIKSRALYIYDPEHYENFASSAEVYVKGNFVMLFCLPDNELALRSIGNMI